MRTEGTQAFVFQYSCRDEVRLPEVVGAVIAPPEESKIPFMYHEFLDVFDKEKADELPKHGPQDHAIDTKDRMPPFGPVYNLSVTKLHALREYFDEHIAKGFIVSSSSLAGAPILFIKKTNEKLKLCVDYRGLNAIIVKNRYSISFISQLLNMLVEALIFIKIDFKTAYNSIRIRARDEWKTAFRCHYGQYEYRILPFGLINGFATFQSYINMVLREFIDDFVIVYLNDILIFSKSIATHPDHVRKILAALRKHSIIDTHHT